MRQVGTIPPDIDSKTLVDHLFAQGISTRVEDRGAERLLWVHNEDHLANARRLLDEYLRDPAAPHFRAAEQTAKARRIEAEQLDHQFRKNYRDLSRSWDQPGLRKHPVTSALVFLSAAAFILHLAYTNGDLLSWDVYRTLSFSLNVIDEFGQRHSLGLSNILSGQLWRLVTPIFIHFGYLHILFNMWALLVIGFLIESRRGGNTLAAVVLMSAVASNAGQYAYNVSSGHELAMFGGMSGVVYALFGYVWMKGHFEPEQGMRLHPSTVQTMLIWLVICFTGAVGNIANTAHVIGLIVGVFLGLARV